MTYYFVQRYNAAVQKLGTSNIKKQNSDYLTKKPPELGGLI